MSATREIRIAIRLGDLTAQTVNAMVNPANSRGAMAGAIVVEAVTAR